MRTLTLALLLGVSGCIVHSGSSGSGGGSGSTTFSFGGCSSGCGLDQNAVAAGGARTSIHVSGPQFADVRSTAPDVATFTNAGGNDVAVLSGHAGVTTLELLDGSGRTLASADVTVVDTARLSINAGWPGAAPLVVESTPMVFHVTTLDANGRVTKGDGSVTFTLGGTLSRVVQPLAGDAIAFVGTPGSGTIDASCPSATLSQPITIVPASAVTHLAIDAATQPNNTAIVTVQAVTAQGNAYAPPCVWQSSDASVTLASRIGPELDLGPGEVAVFNLNRAGSFTATCTTAGQTATVTLSR